MIEPVNRNDRWVDAVPKPQVSRRLTLGVNYYRKETENFSELFTIGQHTFPSLMML
jgi:hypothetical protein